MIIERKTTGNIGLAILRGGGYILKFLFDSWLQLKQTNNAKQQNKIELLIINLSAVTG